MCMHSTMNVTFPERQPYTAKVENSKCYIASSGIFPPCKSLTMIRSENIPNVWQSYLPKFIILLKNVSVKKYGKDIMQQKSFLPSFIHSFTEVQC